VRSSIGLKAFAALLCAFLLAGAACAQTSDAYEPIPGQPGKDVIWVPTPNALVEKMLDMARVTPKDYVVDLGSGDGRNVIAAAKRGARALGVEFEPDMVALSRRLADARGVSGKARFVQGDMYEADISQASVLALFLLPVNLAKLMPRFLDLAPGTRIVVNAYQIPGWEPDETGRSDGECGAWCTAHLYIVPAKVAGLWRLPQGELKLEQQINTLSGALSADGVSTPIRNGRVQGERISFSAGMNQYAGRVKGDSMAGSVAGTVHGRWSAVRAR
jgi:SAM-dependent methyltransferase